MTDQISAPHRAAIQAADDHGQLTYEIVGNLKGDENSHRAPPGIDWRCAIVAVKHPKDTRGYDVETATFVEVSAWHINGWTVGDYSNARGVRISHLKDKFEPRRHYEEAHRKKRLEQEVFDNPDKRYKDDTPLRLKHDFDPYVPEAVSRTAPGRINAVVCFVNDVARENLGLPGNLQVILEWSDSYDDFMDYVLNNVETAKHGQLGYALEHDDSTFMHWAQLKFWVWPGCAWGEEDPPTSLVQWLPGQTAGDFITEHGIADADQRRQLFIECRIVADPNAKAKDAAWVARKEAAALRNEGSERPQESGGQRQRARRETPSTQNDADDDNNDDTAQAPHEQEQDDDDERIQEDRDVLALLRQAYQIEAVPERLRQRDIWQVMERDLPHRTAAEWERLWQERVFPFRERKRRDELRIRNRRAAGQGTGVDDASDDASDDDEGDPVILDMLILRDLYEDLDETNEFIDFNALANKYPYRTAAEWWRFWDEVVFPSIREQEEDELEEEF